MSQGTASAAVRQPSSVGRRPSAPSSSSPTPRGGGGGSVMTAALLNSARPPNLSVLTDGGTKNNQKNSDSSTAVSPAAFVVGMDLASPDVTLHVGNEEGRRRATHKPSFSHGGDGGSSEGGFSGYGANPSSCLNGGVTDLIPPPPPPSVSAPGPSMTHVALGVFPPPRCGSSDDDKDEHDDGNDDAAKSNGGYGNSRAASLLDDQYTTTTKGHAADEGVVGVVVVAAAGGSSLFAGGGESQTVRKEGFLTVPSHRSVHTRALSGGSECSTSAAPQHLVRFGGVGTGSSTTSSMGASRVMTPLRLLLMSIGRGDEGEDAAECEPTSTAASVSTAPATNVTPTARASTMRIDSKTINVLCCACETPIQLRRVIKRQPIQFNAMVPNVAMRAAIAKAVVKAVTAAERMRQSQLMASFLASQASPTQRLHGVLSFKDGKVVRSVVGRDTINTALCITSTNAVHSQTAVGSGAPTITVTPAHGGGGVTVCSGAGAPAMNTSPDHHDADGDQQHEGSPGGLSQSPTTGGSNPSLHHSEHHHHSAVIRIAPVEGEGIGEGGASLSSPPEVGSIGVDHHNGKRKHKGSSSNSSRAATNITMTVKARRGDLPSMMSLPADMMVSVSAQGGGPGPSAGHGHTNAAAAAADEAAAQRLKERQRRRQARLDRRMERRRRRAARRGVSDDDDDDDKSVVTRCSSRASNGSGAQQQFRDGNTLNAHAAAMKRLERELNYELGATFGVRAPSSALRRGSLVAAASDNNTTTDMMADGTAAAATYDGTAAPPIALRLSEYRRRRRMTNVYGGEAGPFIFPVDNPEEGGTALAHDAASLGIGYRTEEYEVVDGMVIRKQDPSDQPFSVPIPNASPSRPRPSGTTGPFAVLDPATLPPLPFTVEGHGDLLYPYGTDGYYVENARNRRVEQLMAEASFRHYVAAAMAAAEAAAMAAEREAQLAEEKRRAEKEQRRREKKEAAAKAALAAGIAIQANGSIIMDGPQLAGSLSSTKANAGGSVAAGGGGSAVADSNAAMSSDTSDGDDGESVVPRGQPPSMMGAQMATAAAAALPPAAAGSTSTAPFGDSTSATGGGGDASAAAPSLIPFHARQATLSTDGRTGGATTPAPISMLSIGANDDAPPQIFGGGFYNNNTDGNNAVGAQLFSNSFGFAAAAAAAGQHIDGAAGAAAATGYLLADAMGRQRTTATNASITSINSTSSEDEDVIVGEEVRAERMALALVTTANGGDVSPAAGTPCSALTRRQQRDLMRFLRQEKRNNNSNGSSGLHHHQHDGAPRSANASTASGWQSISDSNSAMGNSRLLRRHHDHQRRRQRSGLSNVSYLSGSRSGNNDTGGAFSGASVHGMLDTQNPTLLMDGVDDTEQRLSSTMAPSGGDAETESTRRGRRRPSPPPLIEGIVPVVTPNNGHRGGDDGPSSSDLSSSSSFDSSLDASIATTVDGRGGLPTSPLMVPSAQNRQFGVASITSSGGGGQALLFGSGGASPLFGSSGGFVSPTSPDAYADEYIEVRIVTHGIADDGTVTFGITTPDGGFEGIRLTVKEARLATLRSIEHITVVGCDPSGRAVIGGTVSCYVGKSSREKLIEYAPQYTRRLVILKVVATVLFLVSIIAGIFACALPYFEAYDKSWYTLYVDKGGEVGRVMYGQLEDCGDTLAIFATIFGLVVLLMVVALIAAAFFYFASSPPQGAFVAPAIGVLLILPCIFLAFVYLSGTSNICENNRQSLSTADDFGLGGGSIGLIIQCCTYMVAYLLLILREYIVVYAFQSLPVARGVAPSRRLSGATPYRASRGAGGDTPQQSSLPLAIRSFIRVFYTPSEPTPRSLDRTQSVVVRERNPAAANRNAPGRRPRGAVREINRLREDRRARRAAREARERERATAAAQQHQQVSTTTSATGVGIVNSVGVTFAASTASPTGPSPSSATGGHTFTTTTTTSLSVPQSVGGGSSPPRSPPPANAMRRLNSNGSGSNAEVRVPTTRLA